MLHPSVVKHMSSVEEYRQRLAALQSSWDTLSMLSHLSGDGTEMGSTREAFETLAADLVKSLAAKTHHKALLGLKSKSQIAIDVLVRNLFERTADIGFLCTDDAIREFASSYAANEARDRDRDLLQRRFRDYVAKYSVYDDVILLAPNGEIMARLNERQAVTRCTDSLLNATLTTRAGYVETFGPSSLFPGNANKLIYSHRVMNGARTLGVLCLCFKFDDEVGGIFAKLRSDADWLVFGFLDANGNVLASSDPWQMPLGAPMPLALTPETAVTRFAGRQYLAVTCPTQGYQGYMGPGWYGHAMIPLEHAFEQSSTLARASSQMLAGLNDSPVIFSEELRRIPVKADEIQRELNRTVWNGNVRLAQRAAADTQFTKVLLREIGNAGRRTQETFERSMGDLQQTVVSAILDDVQQGASLAVDVLDRNLYERANDCRWWALNASLIAQLASASPSDGEAKAILEHINSLYTVYSNIVVFDANKRICALSNATGGQRVGTVLTESWAGASLALRSAQEFAVSSFDRSHFYGDEHTFVFGAGLRQSNGRTVGGIGLIFDSKPQLSAMLHDALPRNEAGQITPGCIGLFVDKELRVVASTGDHTLGTKAQLPADLLDGDAARLIELDGMYYAAGSCRASGYREFTGLDLSAIMLLPLGPVRANGVQPKAVSHRNLQRSASSGEQMLDIATFRCADQWLGLLRDQVVESVDGASLRAVPGAPAWYAGLLMYRGLPLPVVDLAKFVNKSNGARGRDVVIAQTSTDAPMVGLLVDNLDDIPEIAANRILPVADFAQRGGPNIVDRAVRPTRPEDPVLFIVNLDQVLMHARSVISAPARTTAVKAP